MKHGINVLSVLLSAALLLAVVCFSAGAENTPSRYLLGDADGDSAVSVLDVTTIQRRLANIPVKRIDEYAADIDGSGLNVTDTTLIQRYLAGLRIDYSIGEWIVIEPTQPNTDPSVSWFKPGNNELPFVQN